MSSQPNATPTKVEGTAMFPRHLPSGSPMSSTRRSSSLDDFNRPWFLQFRFIMPLALLIASAMTALLRDQPHLHHLLNFSKVYSEAKLRYEFLVLSSQMSMLTGVWDYSRLSEFKSPAGAIYLYALLHKLSSHFPKAMAALPLAIYCMILVLTGYLMRRSRLPAPFLLAFVFPVAFFLQGTLISFPLPELFAVLGLLCSLATLSGGLYCLSIACTTLTLSVDVSLMGPLLPALWLCYLRALGFRKSLICSGVGLLVWIVVSAPYILANPAAYFMQVSASDGSSWNPMYWFLEFLGRKYHLSPVSSEGLRAVVSNPWAKTIKVGVLYGLWTQYRWLRSDGGFIAFVNKYAAWQRGHGIRPNPWTPREAMTVVTEALLLMLLVKSPNLIFAGDFPALTVSLALIWGVALAYPLPVPAIFGVLGLMAFLLSFLVRDLVPFIEDDLQFHVHLPRSLHFLPLVLLPLLEVAVLLLAPRELSRARTTAASASPVMPATTSKHVSGGASISHPPPSTSSLVRNVHSREHHRRSLSQSRR